MNQTVTAQDIQKLPVFDTFDRTDRVMALKSFNIKQINQGLIVYRSSKKIDPRITGRNLRVLKELIKNEEQIT